MNPILLDIPNHISTPRLLMRPPQAGDGSKVYAAVRETKRQLARWMPWAQGTLSEKQFEEWVRRASAQWILREDMALLIWDKNKRRCLGGTGLHRIKWDVPSFEIGYWLRHSSQGKGLALEATLALAHFCFDVLKAKRIEIKCDEDNAASAAIPERLNFTKEARLQNDSVASDGKRSYRRTTIVYAITTAKALPPIKYKYAER